MLRKYWKELSEEGRNLYCSNISCSRDTMQVSYLPSNPLRRKTPSRKRLMLMVVHSDGKLTLESLLEYFVGEGVRKLMGIAEKSDPVSGV